MRFSLVSRELIADSIEAVVRGHCLRRAGGLRRLRQDAAGRDDGDGRLRPALGVRLRRRALPGRWRGRDVTMLDAYEGVGAVITGAMSEAELDGLERACLPTIGSCAGQFTANTMAMVSEALGLASRVGDDAGGVFHRAALARRAGATCSELLREGGPLPRELVTRSQPRERRRGGRGDRRLDQRRAAPARDRARGRHPLHPRRRRRGVRRTPLIADLQPGGKYLARDVQRDRRRRRRAKRAARRRPPAPRLRRPSGRTSARIARGAAPDGEVVRAASRPISPNGGVVVRGNLCPDGALLKVAGLKNLAFRGPARVFESEEECMAVVRTPATRPAACW